VLYRKLSTVIVALSLVGLSPLSPSSGLADDSPTHVVVSVPQGVVSGRDLVGHLSIKTRHGLERIVLKRIPVPRIPVFENGSLTDTVWEEPILFKGYVRERSSRKWGTPRSVRGDIVSGKLRVYFEGRRSPRRFAVKTADLGVNAAARVTSVPTTKRFGCGHDHRYSAGSLSAGLSGAVSAAALPATAVTAIFTPPRVLELGIDADFEFFQRYGSASVAEMKSIINAAQAFYVEQIGLNFKVKSAAVSTNPNVPSSSSDAETLLTDYAQTVLGGPSGRTADIFHLFSGKDELTFTSGSQTFVVVGLAGSPQYNEFGVPGPGPVCITPGNSVGLSQRIADSVQAIVTAHEIGHNMGATHPDQDFPSQTLPTTIMSSQIAAEGNLFSEYSRRQIATQISDHGECLAVESKFLTFGAKVSGARFDATFTPTSALGTGCKTSIYASKIKKDLQVRLTKAARLNRTTIRKRKTLKLRGTVRNSGSPRRFYVRAVTSCTVSGVKRVQGSPIISLRARDSNPMARLQNKLRIYK
jgi:hypothetical protein